MRISLGPHTRARTHREKKKKGYGCAVSPLPSDERASKANKISRKEGGRSVRNKRVSETDRGTSVPVAHP